MRRIHRLFITVSAAAVALPGPAQAQDAPTVTIAGPKNPQPGVDKDNLDAAFEMMRTMFETEPLTPDEERRVPAARSLVDTIMPAGFYGDMMGEMMDGTLRPMFAMFSGPDFVIAERTGKDMSDLEDLSEEDREQLAAILDPAYDQRGEAMMDAMMTMLTGTFAVIEEPIKEGLSRAYARRFTSDQMTEIADFFATDTGALYATESMKLFADPEVMGASMKAMPAVFAQMGDMTEAMQAAEAELPAKRSYADLTPQQRTTATRLLGITEDELRNALDTADAAARERARRDAEMAEAMRDMQADDE